MKQLVLTGKQAIQLKETKLGTLKHDHVEVEIRYFGINFADYLCYQGQYPDAPKGEFAPGYEFSGVVTKSTATNFKPGDEVWGIHAFSCYADTIQVPAHFCFHKPENFTLAEAAAFPVSFATAFFIVRYMGNLQEGQRLLIHSAAGGVGQAMVQLGLQRNARVLATVGSDAKVKSMSAQYPDVEFVNYQTTDLKSYLHNRQFDMIADPFGGKVLKDFYKNLAPFGKMVNFGFSSALGGSGLIGQLGFLAKSPFFHILSLLKENKMVGGMNLARIFEQPDVLKYVVPHLVDGFRDGSFSVSIYKEVPFSEAGIREAFDAFASRKVQGKMICNVS